MAAGPEQLNYEIVHETPNQLGESPVWNERTQRLYWVDIKGRRILRLDPASGVVETRNVPGKPGMLALRTDDGLVIAQDRALAKFDFDSGTLEPLAQIEPEANTKVRLNDSKVDRQQRLWISSMADPTIPGEKHGSLFRWQEDQAPEFVLGPVGVGNGLAFAPDGETFYFADTHARTVWQCRLNPEDGALLDQQVFAQYLDEPGRPDGACVDAEGYYWLAVVDGWRLDRFAPDGRLNRSLAVPFQKPSCPGFGGAKLDQLYVTSIATGSSTLRESNQPHAGKLVVFEPGVCGIEEPRISLSASIR